MNIRILSLCAAAIMGLAAASASAQPVEKTLIARAQTPQAEARPSVPPPAQGKPVAQKKPMEGKKGTQDAREASRS